MNEENARNAAESECQCATARRVSIGDVEAESHARETHGDQQESKQISLVHPMPRRLIKQKMKRINHLDYGPNIGK